MEVVEDAYPFSLVQKVLNGVRSFWDVNALLIAFKTEKDALNVMEIWYTYLGKAVNALMGNLILETNVMTLQLIDAY